jgi:AraC-like DNA-binding protein
MHNHFRENLYLKDVAQQANLAPNYFSEAFHKLTGIPFQTYLQDLRLRFALALLRVSDLSVTEICYASGFNTLSHFLRVFKQKFHQSPNTFRRETPDFKAICIPGCSICSHPQHVLSSSQKTMCQSKH